MLACCLRVVLCAICCGFKTVTVAQVCAYSSSASPLHLVTARTAHASCLCTPLSPALLKQHTLNLVCWLPACHTNPAVLQPCAACVYVLQLKLFHVMSDGLCMLVSLQATERVVSACQGEWCKGYHPPHGSDRHPGHCLRYPLHSCREQH